MLKVLEGFHWSTVIAPLVVGLCAALLARLYNWKFSSISDQSDSSLGWLLETLRNWFLATLIVLLVQTFLYTTVLTSRIVAQADSSPYVTAKSSIASARSQTLFSLWAGERLEVVASKLRQIARGEVTFDSPSDLTSSWLSLIRKSGNSINATNVIAPSYWEEHENMGPRSENAHRAALNQGVQIRRLYIIDDKSPDSIEALKGLSTRYRKLGVVVKFIEQNTVEALNGFSNCAQALSTVDFVIFDEGVVLMTTASSENIVLGGRLSRLMEEHVRPSLVCFEDWWAEGQHAIAELDL